MNGTIRAEGLAALLDVTPEHLYVLSRKKVVEKVGRGIFDLRASVNGYIRWLRKSKHGLTEEYYQARTKKMQEAATMAELDRLERMGHLVNAQAMQREVTNAFAEIRAQWLIVPHIAPQLEGHTAVEIQEILRDHVNHCLTSMAEGGTSKILDKPEATQ